MRRARYRTTAVLVASLALALGCGGGDDDDDSGTTGDGGADGSDGDGGSDDGADDGGGPDAAVADCEPQTGTNLYLERVTGGFDEPIFVTSPPGDPRLFVVSKHGVISIIKDGQTLPVPFLDIDPRVNSTPGDGEQGLLGLAFHPDYARNGRFYVVYTGTATSGQSSDILSEFRVDPATPDRADPESEREILAVTDFEGNHNGGMIAFGDDGYLYIGLGDGGGGDDDHGTIGNGQDKSTLLGDMLRIDVKLDAERPPFYQVPGDNPYAYSKGPERKEIFISGVRNPWRWSFDRQTYDLYIGDVGQGQWEEVDVLPKGQQSGVNLGWRVMEGMVCFGGVSCNPADFTLPVTVYANPGGGTGAAIVGGYVYRGGCFPDLQGWYFYGDYPSARIWKFRYDGGQATEEAEVTADIDPQGQLSGLSSFGQDATGELYVISMRSGEIFHITAGP
jgi:glucose/arabinose dehydrogenase